MGNKDLKSWEVFIQTKAGLPHKHVGNLKAVDAEMAIQNARDVYTRRKEGTSLWVVPTDSIVASQSQDEESFFEPADDKIYRNPTFYIIPEEVKHI